MNISPSHANYPEFNDLSMAMATIVNRHMHPLLSQMTDEEAVVALSDLRELWTELAERTERGLDA